MLLLPEAAGPSDPVLATPARRPGSIRRTSNIDTARPDGLRGDAVVDARARDLRTDADGTGGRGRGGRARGPDRWGHPRVWPPSRPRRRSPRCGALLGVLVGPGFRPRVDEAVPEECEAGTLLYLLLDDLPGAALVSGYALQRAGAFDEPSIRLPSGGPTCRPSSSSRDDLCAGWAHDATMMVTSGATGTSPCRGPAGARARAGRTTRWSWHAMAPTDASRRPPPPPARSARHLTEPGGLHRLDVHFRDSHADEDVRRDGSCTSTR